jgi:hypothetical protein
VIESTATDGSIQWVLTDAKQPSFGLFKVVGLSFQYPRSGTWRSPFGVGGVSEGLLEGGVGGIRIIGTRRSYAGDTTSLRTRWSRYTSYISLNQVGNQVVAVTIANTSPSAMRLTRINALMYHLRPANAPIYTWLYEVDPITNKPTVQVTGTTMQTTVYPDYPSFLETYDVTVTPAVLYHQTTGVAWPIDVPNNWPLLMPGKSYAIIMTQGVTANFLILGANAPQTSRLQVTGTWSNNYASNPNYWVGAATPAAVWFDAFSVSTLQADSISPLANFSLANAYSYVRRAFNGTFVAPLDRTMGAAMGANDAFALLFFAPSTGAALLDRFEVALRPTAIGWVRAALELWRLDEATLLPAVRIFDAGKTNTIDAFVGAADVNTGRFTLSWDASAVTFPPLGPTRAYSVVVRMLRTPGPVFLVPSNATASVGYAAGSTSGRANLARTAEILGTRQFLAANASAPWQGLEAWNAPNRTTAFRLFLWPARNLHTDNTDCGASLAASGLAFTPPDDSSPNTTLAVAFEVVDRGVPVYLDAMGLFVRASRSGYYGLTARLGSANRLTGMPTFLSVTLPARTFSLFIAPDRVGQNVLIAWNMTNALWPPLAASIYTLAISCNVTDGSLAWTYAGAGSRFSAGGVNFRNAAVLTRTGTRLRPSIGWTLPDNAATAPPVSLWMLGFDGKTTGFVVADNSAGLTLFGDLMEGAPINSATAGAMIFRSDPMRTMVLTSVSFALLVGSSGSESVTVQIEMWACDPAVFIPTRRAGLGHAISFTVQRSVSDGGVGISPVSIPILPEHNWPLLTGQPFAIVVRLVSGTSSPLVIQAMPDGMDMLGAFQNIGLLTQRGGGTSWYTLPGKYGSAMLTANDTRVLYDTTAGLTICTTTSIGWLYASAWYYSVLFFRVDSAVPIRLDKLRMQAHSSYSRNDAGIGMGIYSVTQDSNGKPMPAQFNGIPAPSSGGFTRVVAESAVQWETGWPYTVWVWDMSGQPALQPGRTYAFVFGGLGTSNLAFRPASANYGTNRVGGLSSLGWSYLAHQQSWAWNVSGHLPAITITTADDPLMLPRPVVNSTVFPASPTLGLAQDLSGQTNRVGAPLGFGRQAAVVITSDPSSTVFVRSFTIMVSVNSSGTVEFRARLWSVDVATGVPTTPLPTAAIVPATLRVPPSGLSTPLALTFTPQKSWPPLAPGSRYAIVVASPTVGSQLTWHFSRTGSGTAGAAALANVNATFTFSVMGFSTRSIDAAAGDSSGFGPWADVLEEDADGAPSLSLNLVSTGPLATLADNTAGLTRSAPAPGSVISGMPHAVIFESDATGQSRITSLIALMTAPVAGFYGVSATLFVADPVTALPLAPISNGLAVLQSVLRVDSASVNTAVAVSFDIGSGSWPSLQFSTWGVALSTNDTTGSVQWLHSGAGANNPGPFIIRAFAKADRGDPSDSLSWMPALVPNGNIGALLIVGEPTVLGPPPLLDTAAGLSTYATGDNDGYPIGSIFTGDATAVVFRIPERSMGAVRIDQISVAILGNFPAVSMSWEARLFNADDFTLSPTTPMTAQTLSFDLVAAAVVRSSDALVMTWSIPSVVEWPVLGSGAYAIIITCSIGAGTGPSPYLPCGVTWAATQPELATMAADPGSTAAARNPDLAPLQLVGLSRALSITLGGSNAITASSWTAPSLDYAPAILVQGARLPLVFDNTALGTRFVPLTSIPAMSGLNYGLGRYIGGSWTPSKIAWVFRPDSTTAVRLTSIIALVHSDMTNGGAYDFLSVKLNLHMVNPANNRPFDRVLGTAAVPRSFAPSGVVGASVVFDIPDSWPILDGNATYALVMRADPQQVNAMRWLGEQPGTPRKGLINFVTTWYNYRDWSWETSTVDQNYFGQDVGGYPWAVMIAGRSVPKAYVQNNSPLPVNTTAKGVPIAAGVAFTVTSDNRDAAFLQSISVLVSVTRSATVAFALQLFLANTSTGAPVTPLSTAPLVTVTRYVPTYLARTPINVSFAVEGNIWPPLVGGQLYSVVLTASASDPRAVASLLYPATNWTTVRRGNATVFSVSTFIGSTPPANVAVIALQGFTRRSAAGAPWVSLTRSTFDGRNLPAVRLAGSGRLRTFLDTTAGGTVWGANGIVLGPLSAPDRTLGGPACMVFQSDESFVIGFSVVSLLVSASIPGYYRIAASLWNADYWSATPTMPMNRAPTLYATVYISPFRVRQPTLVTFLPSFDSWPRLSSGIYALVLSSNATNGALLWRSAPVNASRTTGFTPVGFAARAPIRADDDAALDPSAVASAGDWRRTTMTGSIIVLGPQEAPRTPIYLDVTGSLSTWVDDSVIVGTVAGARQVAVVFKTDPEALAMISSFSVLFEVQTPKAYTVTAQLFTTDPVTFAPLAPIFGASTVQVTFTVSASDGLDKTFPVAFAVSAGDWPMLFAGEIPYAIVLTSDDNTGSLRWKMANPRVQNPGQLQVIGSVAQETALAWSRIRAGDKSLTITITGPWPRVLMDTSGLTRELISKWNGGFTYSYWWWWWGWWWWWWGWWFSFYGNSPDYGSRAAYVFQTSPQWSSTIDRVVVNLGTWYTHPILLAVVQGLPLEHQPANADARRPARGLPDGRNRRHLRPQPVHGHRHLRHRHGVGSAPPQHHLRRRARLPGVVVVDDRVALRQPPGAQQAQHVGLQLHPRRLHGGGVGVQHLVPGPQGPDRADHAHVLLVRPPLRRAFRPPLRVPHSYPVHDPVQHAVQHADAQPDALQLTHAVPHAFRQQIAHAVPHRDAHDVVGALDHPRPCGVGRRPRPRERNVLPLRGRLIRGGERRCPRRPLRGLARPIRGGPLRRLRGRPVRGRSRRRCGRGRGGSPRRVDRVQPLQRLCSHRRPRRTVLGHLRLRPLWQRDLYRRPRRRVQPRSLFRPRYRQRHLHGYELCGRLALPRDGCAHVRVHHLDLRDDGRHDRGRAQCGRLLRVRHGLGAEHLRRQHSRRAGARNRLPVPVALGLVGPARPPLAPRPLVLVALLCGRRRHLLHHGKALWRH